MWLAGQMAELAADAESVPRAAATVAAPATVRVYARAERDGRLTGMVPASVRVRREAGGGAAAAPQPRFALAVPARPAGARAAGGGGGAGG